MDKAADKALELLQQLSEKIGRTVEELYPYFVRQVLIEAWATVFAYLFITGMIFVGGVYLLWHARPPSPGDISDFALGIAMMVAAIAVFGIAVAYNAAPILNPQYGAIREIMRAASGK